MRLRGVTILFVSHAAAEVKAIADRVLWLDHGRVAALGDPDRVVGQYLAAMAERDSALPAPPRGRRAHRPKPPWRPTEAEPLDSIPNVDRRHGDGRAEVLGIGVFDEQGEPLHLLDPLARIQVRISMRAKARIERPIAGFLLRNQLGIDFSGTDTAPRGLPRRAPRPRRRLHGDLSHRSAGALSRVVLFFAVRGRRLRGQLHAMRLDR